MKNNKRDSYENKNDKQHTPSETSCWPKKRIFD